MDWTTQLAANNADGRVDRVCRKQQNDAIGSIADGIFGLVLEK
jgi:hypothetical protein